MSARTFPETAAWAPGGDLIVFGALDGPDGSGPDLFAIAPDGTGLRRLTTLATTGGSATHPDVAPDGSSIVFSANMPGRGTVLAAVGIDGGEIGPALGTYVAGVHPRWRPAP